MGREHDIENFWILAGVLLVLGLLVAFGGISDEDIGACVSQTGWNETRCRVELSR